MSASKKAVVLVHNLGHREVYVKLLEASERYRVSNQGQFSFARDICMGLDEGSALAEGKGGTDILVPPLALPWRQQRIRERFLDRRNLGVDAETATVESLFFPLVDAAAGAVFQDRGQESFEFHVVLLSSGPPINSLTEGASTQAKSTLTVSDLVARHLALRWPNLVVHRVHRLTDQPFTFSNSSEHLRHVDEIISRVRRPVVEAFGEDWERQFEVYVSANTGTIAAISSVLEGLRHHKPSLVHIPAAYVWPEEGSGVPGLPSATVLSNDELTQRPAREAEEIGDEAHACAIREMRRWRAEFVRARPTRADENTDADQMFWFRKGKKEVLALLVTKCPVTGALASHRGVNIEVSLPTGTLCAERNAIGSAFATRPDLRRQDILAVAVLSLDTGLGPRLGPCGACSEWLRKVAEVNPDFRVITFADESCSKVFIEPVG